MTKARGGLLVPFHAHRFRVSPTLDVASSLTDHRQTFMQSIEKASLDLLNGTLTVLVRQTHHCDEINVIEAVHAVLRSSMPPAIELFDANGPTIDGNPALSIQPEGAALSHELVFDYANPERLLHKIVWSITALQTHSEY